MQTKTNIKAEIVADSTDSRGNRLISVLATFPRIILAEVNTHRMLSKNTSSSRAIPFTKMVEAVQENPFIPIAWQKHHSGMQGSEYLTEFNSGLAQEEWLKARDLAIQQATILNKGNKIPDADGGLNVTKQLCNRLLEPFMWTTMLITGSKEGWDNFFELRCPQYLQQGKTYKSKKEAIKNAHSKLSDKKGLPTTDLEWLQVNKGQAEIHIMDLAEKIYDAMNESTPEQLKAGEWHIPFYNSINIDKVIEITPKGATPNPPDEDSSALEGMFYSDVYDNVIKISTAMAARTSYTVVGDEKEIDYQKMINLHDRLIAQNPPHSSPMEHCARAMSDKEYYSYLKGAVDIKLDINGFINIKGHTNPNVFGWCRNFKGFIQYRHIVETNNN